MTDSYNAHADQFAADAMQSAQAQKTKDAKTIAELSKLVRDWNEWASHEPACESAYSYLPGCNCGRSKLGDLTDALLARLDAEQAIADAPKDDDE